MLLGLKYGICLDLLRPVVSVIQVDRAFTTMQSSNKRGVLFHLVS